jgi:hypothetical protein
VAALPLGSGTNTELSVPYSMNNTKKQGLAGRMLRDIALPIILKKAARPGEMDKMACCSPTTSHGPNLPPSDTHAVAEVPGKPGPARPRPRGRRQPLWQAGPM